MHSIQLTDPGVGVRAVVLYRHAGTPAEIARCIGADARVEAFTRPAEFAAAVAADGDCRTALVVVEVCGDSRWAAAALMAASVAGERHAARRVFLAEPAHVDAVLDAAYRPMLDRVVLLPADPNLLRAALHVAPVAGRIRATQWTAMTA